MNAIDWLFAGALLRAALFAMNHYAAYMDGYAGDRTVTVGCVALRRVIGSR